MTFVRALIADLVAKRLWPVALALVAALVAVPVVVATGGGGETAVPSSAAVPETEESPAAVSVAADDPRRGPNSTGRNPFKQPAVPQAPNALGGASLGGGMPDLGGGSDGGTGGGGTGGSAGGGIPGLDDIDVIPVGGGGSGSGSGGSGGSGKADKRDSYRVDLRFGTDGSLTSRRDVPRLSPLPSADDPFFVFLGVLADGKTAVFLISSDAQATGDGTCRPTPQNCERVEMEAGETEFFDVTKPDGQVKQYQLDVVNVSRQRSASAAVASAARTREDPAGRKVLNHAMDTKQVDISSLAYSRELGLIVPSGERESDGSFFGGFRTDLRFGLPGALTKRYNLARLTPLPSVKDPSLIYMGVIGDDNEAFFLNPSQAATSGDAVCDPSPEECSRVRMKAGQNGVFDVPRLDGGTDEYHLAIDAITPVQADSAEEAEAMRTRESKAGRVILRRLITEVGGLVSDVNYSDAKGKLYKVDG